MDLVIFIAALAIIVGAVIAFVTKQWALGFIGAGLAIFALAQTTVFNLK